MLQRALGWRARAGWPISSVSVFPKRSGSRIGGRFAVVEGGNRVGYSLGI
jgi:hypothetical protein